MIQSIAVASLGIFGNALIVFILSIYIAVDRDRVSSFLYRLVPPRFSDEAHLFQTSVGRSFGGFIRSQVTQGVIFAALAAVTSIVLGLPYAAFTASLSGLLQAIPFFGPFVSWAPPVVVAVFAKPEAILPALVIMGVGWFVTMNVIQPRLMAGALSIHPIVVLGSVIIGSKVAGIAGAIFSIPIAAVASAFFFYYLQRTEHGRSVSERAAARVSAREGRRFRAPRLPGAGRGDAGRRDGRHARPSRRRRPATAPRRRARPRPTVPRPLTAAADARPGRMTRRRDAGPDDDAAGAILREGAAAEGGRPEARAHRTRAGARAARPRPVPPSRALRSAARPLAEWDPRPRILVTNDDGIDSRGLAALARALEAVGDVFVIAPESNQSTVGHLKTMLRPLRIRERRMEDGRRGWAIDGSPTDAVSAAFLGYFGHGFDLVASGVNYGNNLGDDMTYSGTVSAAMEGVINGCPAFAISQALNAEVDFALAERAAVVVARGILEHGLAPGELLNVNVPAVPPEECRGIEITRLGQRVYLDELVERVDPRGLPYYWIGGQPPSGVAVRGTDFSAVEAGSISVTPIHLDLTARGLLRRLRDWDLSLEDDGRGR